MTKQTAKQTADLTRGQLLVLFACFASLGILGWIDYITGYELGFFIFYSAPVGIAAWHAGRWPAIGVAFAASLSWWLADSYNGANFSSIFYFYWNNAIHFLGFVINAVSISEIKKDLDRNHIIKAELELAREALRTTAKLLTSCPACGKSHIGREPGKKLEETLVGRIHTELSGALCDNCLSIHSISD